MRILGVAAALTIMLLSGTQTQAARVVVASTSDASQSIVDEAVRQVREKGHTVVAIAASGDALLDARQRAGEAMGSQFQKAKEFYVGERYKGAISLLEAEELRSLTRLLESASGRAVLVQLNLWLGCLHFAAGETAATDARFRLAVALDATAELDAVLWPPEYVRAFATAKRSEQALGQVTFQGLKRGAMVSIDGRLRGADSSHATFALPAGEHYIFVHAPGRARVAKRFSVVPAGVASLSAEGPSTTAEELAHDLRNMQPAWLDESVSWRLALLRASGAARMVVVRNTGSLFYDQEGRRLPTLDGTFEGKSVSLESSETRSTAGRPLYKRWWLWTGVVAVIGGSVAIWATTRDAGSVHGQFVQ